MKTRKWKIAALLATSTILLQGAGCIALVVQILAQQLVTSALSSIVDGAFGGDGSTDAGMEP
jgi:hypothetical protein